MQNLLTQKYKKSIRKEYAVRIIIVSLSFLSFIILLGILSLFPSYLASSLSEKVAREQVDIIKKSISTDEQDNSRSIILNTNKKISFLDSDIARVQISLVFETIVSEKTSGIKISSLSYESGGESGEGVVTIIGMSDGREELIAFRNILEEKVLFKQVELPVSNLAKGTDIAFSVKVTGEF